MNKRKFDENFNPKNSVRRTSTLSSSGDAFILSLDIIYRRELYLIIILEEISFYHFYFWKLFIVSVFTYSWNKFIWTSSQVIISWICRWNMILSLIMIRRLPLSHFYSKDLLISSLLQKIPTTASNRKTKPLFIVWWKSL